MNPLNNESDLNLQQVQHAVKVPNTISGLSKLNKDGLKTKVLRVGKELYVCELDADGKLNDQTKKFIQQKRIKLWHESHTTKKNKHCSTCRCEENLDENGNRIYAKRGPKGPRNPNKTNNEKSNTDVDGSSKIKKQRGRPSTKDKSSKDSVKDDPLPSSSQTTPKQKSKKQNKKQINLV